MSNINIAFSRCLLSNVMEDIKTVTSGKERKDAWVYKLMEDHWEFHGPEGFYWHGSADNAYDARAKGWSSWWGQLVKDGIRESAKDRGKKMRTAL